jgi:hypothetical protein
MLKTISARTLVNFSTESLWELLTGDFNLQFDDGVIQTNAKETTYSSYAWDFHRQYPKTPLLMKHHVRTVVKNNRLGAKTHLLLLGNVMWSSHDAYLGLPESPDEVTMRDIMSQKIYEITSKMYSELSRVSERFVVSLDITDFLELHNDKELVEVKSKAPATQAGVDMVYKTVSDIISSKTKYIHNPIAKAYQIGVVNKNQVLQVMGWRGYLTEIDSVVFKNPIRRGYFEGIRRQHDHLIESRSGSKNLSYSKEMLEDAEYFARRLQILCQVVANVHVGDCGSQHYLLFKVNSPVYENDVCVFKGDLHHLKGKFYLDEITNTLKVISEKDSHLNNKMLKLRSVIAGCMHTDPHGVCATCFGKLADSVPENSNIGHMCATALTEQSSQGLLSVKHLDGSSVVSGITLNIQYRGHLDITADMMSLLLSPKIMTRTPYLIIKQVDFKGLTDLDIVDDLNDLNETRVSAMSSIGIRTVVGTDIGGFPIHDIIVIPISIGKRLASFTTQALRHIKQTGHELDDKGNVLIDMEGWDYNKPMLTLPMKHYNMGDHSDEIAKIIESKVDNMVKRGEEQSIKDTLIELYDLVNSKLDVNLATLEIITYAACTVDSKNGNFNLPKPWTKKGLGISSSTIPGRSLGPAMAHEGHRDTIYSAKSFFNENRPSSIMDCFLMPAEAVADLKN